MVTHAVTQPRLITDYDLQLLYSDIMQIESESLRVTVTLDALQEELDQDHNDFSKEQLFSELIRLYKYDSALNQLHKEFTDELQSLLNPEAYSSGLLAPEQFKDTVTIPKDFLDRIPEDAIPLPSIKPIKIK
jgi:hypothetical protein